MFFNAWTMEKWIKGPPQKQGDYRIDWVKFYPLANSKDDASNPSPARNADNPAGPRDK
jgi:hypothetical protein